MKYSTYSVDSVRKNFVELCGNVHVLTVICSQLPTARNMRLDYVTCEQLSCNSSAVHTKSQVAAKECEPIAQRPEVDKSHH